MLLCMLGMVWLAEPIQAQVTRQKFDDWIKECLTEKGKPERCHIAHTLADKKGRKIIYFIVARRKDQTYLEVNAPLGLLIPAGIKVQVDDQNAAAMQLVDCNRTGCRAVLALSAQQIDQLKQGASIVAGFVDSKSGKSIALKGSLTGFAAAAKALGL